MDRGRVRAALAAVPFSLAVWSLLGAQGARVGGWIVPTLSSWWVAAALVLAYVATRRGVPVPGRRLGLEAVGLAILLVVLAAFRYGALHPALELAVEIDGERIVRATRLQLEERRDLRRLTGERRNLRLETRALLAVPYEGRYRFELYCDDRCEIQIGDRTLSAAGAASHELDLAPGDVSFALRYRQRGGPASLLFAWDRPGAVELLPIEYYLRAPGASPRSRVGAHFALAALLAASAGLAGFVVRLGRSRASLENRRWIPAAAACLLVLYGGLLRFEALLAHSSLASTRSDWRAVHESLLPWVPPYGIFNPELAPDDPYRADVRSYLDRARDLTLVTFYAPSFREPFYVALTTPFLRLAGGEIGILVASFAFSVATLALFAFVAWRVSGARWAVALLVPVALHEWLVLEAPTGYRMSAYSFFLLATAALPFLAPARPSAAALGGAIAGLTCLIRLSAISVVAPLAALRSLTARLGERARYAAIYGLVVAAIVGPFLWSNFRAHGDPLYSVSFHTEFWLRAEGLAESASGPVSLTRYFTDFGRTWSVAKGTFLGMTVLPLKTFWNGLRHFALLDAAVLLLGVAGLAASLRARPFLTVAYFGHLLPFAYIQNFPSGEMPRFVMPAFFFLVLAIPEGARALASLARRAISSRNGEPGSSDRIEASLP